MFTRIIIVNYTAECIFFFSTRISTYNIVVNTWLYMHSALALQTYIWGVYIKQAQLSWRASTSTIRFVTTDFNQNKWSEQRMKWQKKKKKKKTAAIFVGQCQGCQQDNCTDVDFHFRSFSKTIVRFILLCILFGCEAVKIRMKQSKFAQFIIYALATLSHLATYNCDCSIL